MEKNTIHAIVCGIGWGIGSYKYLNEKGEEEWGYGFARPKNPHDYSPDYECCEESEIAAWKAACAEWDAKEAP